jgi:hypothetical protein
VTPAREPSHPPLQPADEIRLLDFLKGRDAPCPLCGYNLRDLTRPECPECRQALVLSVGLARLRLGWFLTTVTPGLFSGIAAVLVLIPIVLSATSGGGRPPWPIILVDIFGWLSGFVALGIIAGRDRFLRQPVSRQVAAAVFAWLVHLAAFAALVVTAMIM